MQSFVPCPMWGWDRRPALVRAPMGQARAQPRARTPGGPVQAQQEDARQASQTGLSRGRPETEASPRSRSPGRGRPVPALRRDAPSRREGGGRAALPHWGSQEEQEAALHILEADVYAASSRDTHIARLRTVVEALSRWGITAFPPTPASWRALAASLKQGGYRSAAAYLSAYRTEAERRGHHVDQLALRSIKDYTRSCERGQGAPARARPLPFHRLHLLPPGRQPWCVGGPLAPRNAIVAGAWFLTREVELSTSRARLVELVKGSNGEETSIKWHLPASKSDQLAVGVARVHRCQCKGQASPSCPVHAIWDQLLVLQQLFPSRWQAGIADEDLPLFPTAEGQVCSKMAMSDTIRHAATQLGVTLASPDGSERVTGHSLRATGAQGLTMLGWDLWAVQLLGRWGSDVVKAYVREAPLDYHGPRSGSFTPSMDLDALVALVSARVKPTSAVAPDAGEVVAAAVAEAGPQARLASDELVDLVGRHESVTGQIVLNTRSGVHHRALLRQSSELVPDWASVCGWRFGSSSTAVFLPSDVQLPSTHYALCSNCFPQECAAARERLMQ